MGYKRMIHEQEKEPIRINVTEARERFSDLVDQVRYYKEVIILQRYNKDEVAIIPCEEYRNILVLSDADRDMFLSALEKPPKPNTALKKAIRKYHQKYL